MTVGKIQSQHVNVFVTLIQKHKIDGLLCRVIVFFIRCFVCKRFLSTEMVKDLRVRTCLLYAACLGGNQRIINMWLTPEMDINHPPYYSHTASFSMNKTPLYAACAGQWLYQSFKNV